MKRHSPLPRAVVAIAVSLMLTFSPNVFALGPLEKNHPKVQQGMDAYDKGDYEGALKSFDDAKRELPNSPAVELNRGNTLYKLGKLQDAKEAFEHVTQMDDPQLKQRAYYNLGNVNWGLNDEKSAIAAYRNALKLDPKDQAARHNLEVLLKKIKPPQQNQGQDGGTPDGGQDGGNQKDGGTPKQDGGTDGGQKDGGQDGGMDGGRQDGGEDGGDGGQSDAGADGGMDGGQGDGGQGDGGSDGGADGGSPDKGEGKGDKGDGGSDGGEVSPEPSDEGPDAGVDQLPDGGTAMSKEDAEKLLNAMKQNEKNLQLWRFQPKRPRKPNEKDW
jgi:tetratricopeptide (TPR) repeat protein